MAAFSMARLGELLLAAALVCMSSRAHGQTRGRARPLFEPTDLEMEKPGAIQIDAQLGVLRNDESRWKTVVPDVEVDIGISERFELDIDGSYAIVGPAAGGFSFDQAAPDNLWIASKLALWDDRESREGNAWAMGMQLGPKVPVAPDAHGAGYEGLLLVSRAWGPSHLVLNAGALIDPGASTSSARPAGLEGGLDLSLDLGRDLTLLSELGGVRFVSQDRNQLHATAGLSWAATGSLDVSLIALKGLLAAGDQGGALLGFAKRFSVGPGR